MVAQLKEPYMSPQEYLEWEESQPEKYGYRDGYVYAMSGGTLPHNRVAVNLASILNIHLRSSGCITYSADAKIDIAKLNTFHYPDVSVTCDERDRTAVKFLSYPCLIVEVLSPSTEAYDRGDKFKDYRSLETLKEYVLISPTQMRVERYSLNDSNVWEVHYYEAAHDEVDLPKVHLSSVEWSFSLDELYEKDELYENMVIEPAPLVSVQASVVPSVE